MSVGHSNSSTPDEATSIARSLGPHRDITLLLLPSGDSAVLLEAQGGSDDDRWAVIYDLRKRLLTHRPAGFLDLVSTFEHLLISYDCAVTDGFFIRNDVIAALNRSGVESLQSGRRTFDIPTVFGGTFGPDLVDVSEQLGMSAADVVEQLLRQEFVVRFLGAGMEPMCSGAVSDVPITRRHVPRVSVPAGSVALAAHNMAIYPFGSPGGWQLVGRTPLQLCDIAEQPAVTYQAGDRFRLRSIQPGEWIDFEDMRLGETND
ncbi:allophanate hydrolase subunit 1 [Arthrobacter sp. MW3 TE3886]|uniref:5-oxoprolinase subunit B family protein n=1 Tax=Arthrobacter sp. MW3 TE3886 TaxID=3156254 RepID=UPI003511EC67